MFKKFLSAGMSCVIAVNSFFPNVSAKIQPNDISDAANASRMKCVETIELGSVKNFIKNHPTLVWYGLVLVCSLIHRAVSEWKFREWDLRKVTTKIDNLSHEEIDKKIDEEIEKYKKRAPDVFKIDGNLIKKSDKRLFLLTITKLNYLFDKYSGFTERLIDYKRNKAEDKEFLLRRITLKDDGLSIWLKALQATYYDLSGFVFGNLSNYKRLLYSAYKSVNTKFWSPRRQDELIDSIITHEFGHAMETLYVIEKCNLKIPTIRKYYSFKGYLNANKRDLEKFKRCQDKVAIEIINCYSVSCDSNATIKTIKDYEGFSKYGSSSSGEFFAEVFAHLECSDEDKVLDIGKNIERFIVEEMHYLSPKESKFCKTDLYDEDNCRAAVAA